MKCPRCRRTMQRKSYQNSYYYECPACGRSIAKPQAAIQAEQEADNEAERDQRNNN